MAGHSAAQVTYHDCDDEGHYRHPEGVDHWSAVGQLLRAISLNGPKGGTALRLEDREKDRN